MLRLLIVGSGGFLGAVLRYIVTAWVHKALDNPWFPYGTLAVNIVGCFGRGIPRRQRAVGSPELQRAIDAVLEADSFGRALT